LGCSGSKNYTLSYLWNTMHVERTNRPQMGLGQKQVNAEIRKLRELLELTDLSRGNGFG
jgi:hypothetical protein